MKLKTILDPTFPMSMRERIARLKEWAAIKVAASLPETVQYWAFIGYTVKRVDGAPDSYTVQDVLDAKVKH